MNAERATLFLIVVALVLAAAFFMYREPAPIDTEPPDQQRTVEPPVAVPPPEAAVPEPADVGVVPIPESDEFTLHVTSAVTDEPVTQYEVAFLDHTPGNPKAWTIAQANPAQEWETVSDATGSSSWPRSRLDGVQAIGVRADGHASNWVAVDPSARELRIALDPETVLRGRVVDEFGTPVAGAAVSVANQTVDTNAEGRFEARGLSEGLITVAAEHGDYRPEEIALTLSAGKEHDVQLVLKQGGAIVGRVFDESSTVAGAKVAVMPVGDFEGHRETQTDSYGLFRIAGLSPGEWRVMATLSDEPDAVELHQRAIVEAGLDTQVEFIFGQPAIVEGLVIVGDGPAANAHVRARSISGYDEQFTDTRTNDGGWYQLEIVPGTIQLTAELSGNGIEPRKKSVTLTVPAETVEHDFLFDDAVPFSGRIGGTTVDEIVTVYVLPEGYLIDFEVPTWGMDLSRDALAQTVADDSGLFAIESLDPGNYALAILAFTPETPEGVDPLSTARILERDIEIQAAGAHIELSF